MGALNDENKLQVNEKNNKNWHFEKFLKFCEIITFKTICFKLTASGNIFQSILNYKFIRLFSNLRLKKKKAGKKSRYKKNWERKVSKPLKSELSSEHFSVFN